MVTLLIFFQTQVPCHILEAALQRYRVLQRVHERKVQKLPTIVFNF